MEFLVQAATEVPPDTYPWLTPAIAILTILLSSGGIVAWRRLNHDKKLGIAQQEQVEDDALSNRWKAIIEAQTTSLLAPLQNRLSIMEQRVTSLEAELALSRRKYWSAISHIRTLYNWIARHMPDDIEQTQVPAPPVTLAEDI